MAEAVYILCAIMSIACAILLLLGYRRSKMRLLLGSSLCFLFLAAANALLVVDMVVFPNVDMGGPFWRNLLSAIAATLLVIGLLSEQT